MRETILLTGGAGYIGTHINKYLKQKNYNTIILDNLVNGHSEFMKNEHFIQGDIGDAPLLNKIFQENNIQAVIHLAGYAYVGESNTSPEKYYINNVANTLNLLQVMRQHNVNHIVFSSTCSTYGVQDKMPITEEQTQNPINAYGTSKLMIETILKDYGDAYGLNYAILRFFNAAGADSSCEIGEWHEPEPHLIPIILDVALGKRKEISVFGQDYATKDGTCIRDFIHVTDLSSAHILVLEDLLQNHKSHIFNLGSESGYSILEVIEAVQKITGTTIKVKMTDRRKGDPDILVGSAKKIISELGWKPQYQDLTTIIQTAWEWHKKLYSHYIK